MSWLVQPRLLNGPFGDPAVYVDFRFGRRAMLFDLGDVSSLSSRELMRVTHVFVSHAHVDHFFGFDALLRAALYRSEPLQLFGPPGFADRVAAKLDAYTWNLLGPDSPDFVVTAAEFDGEGTTKVMRFAARNRFGAEAAPKPDLQPGALVREADFSVSAALLDHWTPSLAFVLQETLQVNVRRNELDRLGLAVGPWLTEAKRAIRRGEPDDFAVAIPGGPEVALGTLREQAFQIAPGQRVAYVTDALGDATNLNKVVALASRADQLFIEAVYLKADRELAEQNRHLTAAQAGEAARRAGAARVIPFHFSSRYIGREGDLLNELWEAYEGESSEQAWADRVISPPHQRSTTDGQAVEGAEGDS